MLQARGADVVMTRTTADAVGLTERAVMSRRANADVFVSIHLNAFPEGVNPFANYGTSTLFYHQHSELLARYVERELVKRFRIPDLGVHYQNLAVARPAWYPAVLTEGLFLMFPQQEAAMRSAEGRELYAQGIVTGLEDYFRELANGR
jgi:N-acetylmuramoyl-L-alanine amidase